MVEWPSLVGGTTQKKLKYFSLNKTFSSFITWLSSFWCSDAAVVSKMMTREGHRAVRGKKRKNGNFMASSLYAEHRRAEVVKSYVNVISSSGDVKYVLLILLSRNRLSRTPPPSRASHTTARLRFFRFFFLMNRF